MKNNNKYKIVLFLLFILVIPASAVELVVSTETDNVYLGNDSLEVNISIREPDLEAFKFNWNGTNYSSYDSSLILAMNFNNNSAIGENTSKTVDISKYENNGTIVGAVWTSEGRFAGAMQFDGKDDYINSGKSNVLNPSSITIEAWVKFNQLKWVNSIVARGKEDTNNLYFLFHGSDNVSLNRWYFEWGNGTARDSIIYDNIPAINRWYYVAAVFDNGSAELYLDGIKVATKKSSITNISSLDWNTNIGAYREKAHYFNGSIDELRIWNRALSTSEIKMHYQSEFQKVNSTEWRLYNNVSISNVTTNQVGHLSYPALNPIGVGYSNIVLNDSNVDYRVSTKEELLSSLSSAVSGDIIYINDSVEINLTGENDILIPGGVTLASGRGNGGSLGALLYTDELENITGLVQMFNTGGNGVHITGIRLRGPDNQTRNSAYEFSNSRGIYSVHDVEVDNSELSGWSHCAVCLYYTPGSVTPYIHHNFIHHNRRSGLGYGVVHAYGANSLIEANIFDWNRHSIAGDGTVNTSYTARYNLVLGNGNGHSFDMHGGADRHDGTNIAGETIIIYGNTFYKVSDVNNSYPAVVIRGIPTKGSWIHDNYFYYDLQEYAIRQTNAIGNMIIYDNSYNGYLDHIADGAYTYYGWASDIRGNSNSSEIRTVIVNRGNYNPTGRVLNASSGRGIPGAQVKLDANQQYNTTTNILGDYSMSIPAGTYNVSASASGYATNTTTLTINANIVQNFSLSADIPAMIYINGTVNDSVSKTGISGVSVSTNTSLSTTTNATGFYSFAVTPGTYDLTAKIDPIYYANNTIITIGKAFVIQEIELLKKPTGKISGSVTG